MKEKMILLVDDHSIVREGLRYLLEKSKSSYKFSVEEARDGQTAVELCLNNDYDIIIMDYQMPELNGCQTTNEILKNKPKTKVLGLSVFDDFYIIDAMQKCGMMGFITKSSDSTEIITAIETVLNGKEYYSNEIWSKLKKMNSNKFSFKESETNEHLTKRENEILELSLKHLSNNDIAKKLKISIRTVETHKSNMMKKLHAKDPSELLRFAEAHFKTTLKF